jgi:hypothetical protein
MKRQTTTIPITELSRDVKKRFKTCENPRFIDDIRQIQTYGDLRHVAVAHLRTHILEHAPFDTNVAEIITSFADFITLPSANTYIPAILWKEPISDEFYQIDLLFCHVFTDSIAAFTISGNDEWNCFSIHVQLDKCCVVAWDQFDDHDDEGLRRIVCPSGIPLFDNVKRLTGVRLILPRTSRIANKYFDMDDTEKETTVQIVGGHVIWLNPSESEFAIGFCLFCHGFFYYEESIIETGVTEQEIFCYSVMPYRVIQVCVNCNTTRKLTLEPEWHEHNLRILKALNLEYGNIRSV